MSTSIAEALSFGFASLITVAVPIGTTLGYRSIVGQAAREQWRVANGPFTPTGPILFPSRIEADSEDDAARQAQKSWAVPIVGFSYPLTIPVAFWMYVVEGGS